ncbi:MAG TPA: hypothetical protein VGM50_22980 [Gemmatimonadaceae bacterium]|jgi:hypothetical protein
MTSKYVSEHADALADLAEAGSNITFTRVSSTYDSATDTSSAPTTLTIAGYAVETDGDRDTYRRLELTHETAVTLFFSPNEIDDVPLSGDTAVWAGKTVTVAERKAFAPDGVAIAATVVCRR